LHLKINKGKLLKKIAIGYYYY